jgi:hypothetical protein
MAGERLIGSDGSQIIADVSGDRLLFDDSEQVICCCSCTPELGDNFLADQTVKQLYSGQTILNNSFSTNFDPTNNTHAIPWVEEPWSTYHNDLVDGGIARFCFPSIGSPSIIPPEEDPTIPCFFYPGLAAIKENAWGGLYYYVKPANEFIETFYMKFVVGSNVTDFPFSFHLQGMNTFQWLRPPTADQGALSTRGQAYFSAQGRPLIYFVRIGEGLLGPGSSAKYGIGSRLASQVNLSQGLINYEIPQAWEEGDILELYFSKNPVRDNIAEVWYNNAKVIEIPSFIGFNPEFLFPRCTIHAIGVDSWRYHFLSQPTYRRPSRITYSSAEAIFNEPNHL